VKRVVLVHRVGDEAEEIAIIQHGEGARGHRMHIRQFTGFCMDPWFRHIACVVLLRY
jgi:hypothetical protein